MVGQRKDVKKCAIAAGKALLEGFLDPTAFVAGYGKATYESRNRIAEQDYGNPENRGTFKRSWGSALRLGWKRFIPGYAQAGAIVGTLNALRVLATNPKCGIGG